MCKLLSNGVKHNVVIHADMSRYCLSVQLTRKGPMKSYPKCPLNWLNLFGSY